MNPNVAIVLFWLVVAVGGAFGVGNVIVNELLRASVTLAYAKRKGFTEDELETRTDYVARTMRSLYGRLLLNICSAGASILSLILTLANPNPTLSPITASLAVLLIAPCVYYDWATWKDTQSQNKALRKAMEKQLGLGAADEAHTL